MASHCKNNSAVRRHAATVRASYWLRQGGLTWGQVCRLLGKQFAAGRLGNIDANSGILLELPQPVWCETCCGAIYYVPCVACRCLGRESRLSARPRLNGSHYLHWNDSEVNGSSAGIREFHIASQGAASAHLIYHGYTEKDV